MVQKNALLSVYDKTGIVDFAWGLIRLDWNIYSSGGTAKALAEAGVPVTNVAELVGGEAILGHRVVTLSREVHAGLLARHNEDEVEMAALGLPYIDLVCFNLYPLGSAIEDPQATLKSVLELTDIGGPAALNAAAKGGRIVIGDPADYEPVLDWLGEGMPERKEFLRNLRAKAFYITSRYYAPAAAYHSGDRYVARFGELAGECKYGENPFMQPAGLYMSDTDDPLVLHRFEDIGGDARSFINLTDVDCLLQYLTHIAAGFHLNFGFVPYIAVGVKHGNACGAAVGDNPETVIRQMVNGDKRAIFGGVVMTNFIITQTVVHALRERHANDPPRLFDGICAPAFEAGVTAALERTGGKCRMLANPALQYLTVDSLDTTPRMRPVRGGFLMQPSYTFVLKIDESEVHGERLTLQQKQDLVLAWAIGCSSNSNTITLVRDGQLLGNGVGQQDRVGAAELALARAHGAGHSTVGAVAYSDSFFPFPDGPDKLAQAGIRAIFASSGSVRDDDVIGNCRYNNVTLAMQPDKAVRGFAKH